MTIDVTGTLAKAYIAAAVIIATVPDLNTAPTSGPPAGAGIKSAWNSRQ